MWIIPKKIHLLTKGNIRPFMVMNRCLSILANVDFDHCIVESWNSCPGWLWYGWYSLPILLSIFTQGLGPGPFFHIRGIRLCKMFLKKRKKVVWKPRRPNCITHPIWFVCFHYSLLKFYGPHYMNYCLVWFLFSILIIHIPSEIWEQILRVFRY